MTALDDIIDETEGPKPPSRASAVRRAASLLEQMAADQSAVAPDPAATPAPAPAPVPAASSDAEAGVAEAMSFVEPGEDAPPAAPAEVAAAALAGEDPRLAAIMRPSGQIYKPRLIGTLPENMAKQARQLGIEVPAGEITDIEFLRICRAVSLQVMMYGYPGCGKTAWAEAAFGEALLTIEGNGDLEVRDFTGQFEQDPDDPMRYFWVDGPLVTAMIEGRPILIDDATLVAAQVMSKLYPAMDGRRRLIVPGRPATAGGPVVEAKDGFYVMSAHNPGAPGAILAEALASRHALHIEVETDLNLAWKLGVDLRAVQVAQALRELRRKHVVGWAPEMRELLDFKKIADTFGLEMAARNILGACPEEDRDEVARTLQISFPQAVTADPAGNMAPNPLKLGGDLHVGHRMSI